MRFECELPARVLDLNHAGHVGSVEALRLIDEGRMQFLGMPGQRGGPGLSGALDEIPANVGPLTGSYHVEYHAELLLAPQQLPFRVSMWLGHLGGSSFTVQTELFAPGATAQAAPAAVAESTIVLWDFEADRAWQITGPTRERLAAYVGELVALRPRRSS